MKIPRISQNDRPSAVPRGSTGASPYSEIAGVFGAAADVAAAGGKIAADAEQAEAERLRAVREQKQAIVNEVEAGRLAGEFEEDLVSGAEEVQKRNWNNPDKAVSEFYELSQGVQGTYVDSAGNTQVALDLAQKTNARRAAAMREMHDWAIRRQTQKTTGDLEAQKNQMAVAAGRVGAPGALDGFLAQSKARLYPQFEAVYGANAEKEWHEASVRAAEGWARVQGDANPVSTLSALRNPKGALASYLTPEKRDSLINRTEQALEKRGQNRQYELLTDAAGETSQAVELLNAGKLDAQTVLTLQDKNEKAMAAARLDKSFTPEQRAAQVATLKKQKEVLEAVDEIRARGVKYNPEEQITADAAALKEVDKALVKFKSAEEQLPLIVEQMERLVLARREKSISAGAFATAYGHVATAYSKALKDEASNDGLPFWMNAREAGNRELNRVLETKAANVSPDQKARAQYAYMKAYLAASKGDVPVSSEMAKRLARVAVSNNTPVDARVKGD
jgi:hypothetical protein